MELPFCSHVVRPRPPVNLNGKQWPDHHAGKYGVAQKHASEPSLARTSLKGPAFTTPVLPNFSVPVRFYRQLF